MNKPSIFKRIVLRYQISKYLNPFLCVERDDLNSFKTIDNNLSPKLQDLIKSLKEYAETYNIELSKLEKIEKEIEEHNKEVATLKSYNFRSDIDFFYKNPLEYNRSYFNDDFKTSKAIKKYIDIDNDLSLKADEVIKLVENYTLIVDEYNIHKKYEKLVSLSDTFYDSKKVLEISSKLQEIKNQLHDQELFYDFSLLDDNKLNSYVSNHNVDYVKHHLKDNLFDDVNGKSLDEEQRTAILKDETSSLIVAGAGSGKTLTICGKLKYLLSKGIRPEDILLLSYSKKSADDLEMKAKNINHNFVAGTFHKIGLEILEEASNKKFMVENQFSAIIEKYFKEEMKKDPIAMKDILRYYALFSQSNDKNEKYDNNGELYQDLKKADFRTLRDTLSNISNGKNNRITIKKEMVKSIEELEIANFYFLNGIDYIYEKPYEVDVSDNQHRQYTPDFYLKDYGIYHEHYGVDKNGKASQYLGDEAIKYEQGIIWKRAIHQKYNTKCLETFSYEFSNATVFEKLSNLLKENGVKFKPLKNEEIKNAINSIYEEKLFKSMIKLIKSFISLYKARYKDASAFDSLKNSIFLNTYQKVRALLFIDICKRIYSYYVDYLIKEDKIDFDDMILKSKDSINKLSGFKYKYIIVDEFQDISYSRMEFLKSLIDHGQSKLFAVGDDWQSIYRFSGCDLGLFLNFEKYFGKSEISFITSTHRNSQNLQDIVGPFIKKNPQQLDKTIKSNKNLNLPIKLIYFRNDKCTAFQQALSLISKIDPNASILVLGRNNKDVDDILSNELFIKNSFGIERNSILVSKEYPNLKIRYSTVHGSKGLEDDYVIIINAEDDKLGFPNKMEDDSLLNLVLSEDDKMELAEERRLWYVALTRTRNYCYILVDASCPSIFVNEIKEQCEIINDDLQEEVKSPLLCPHCKSGRLILRKDKSGKAFYGCSNYPYCDYTIDDVSSANNNVRCPCCGDFLIKRKGKYGTFFGCHGYPYCRYKINVESKKR